MKHLTDLELIAMQGGNQQSRSEAELLRRYDPLIAKVASRLYRKSKAISDGQDFGDCMSEASILALKAIRRFRPGSGMTIGGFIGIVSRQHYAAASDREMISSDFEDVIDEVDDIEDVIDSRRLQERVVEAFKSLSERKRRCVLKRLEGYKLKDIAADEGVTHQAIDQLLRPAMREITAFISGSSVAVDGAEFDAV